MMAIVYTIPQIRVCDLDLLRRLTMLDAAAAINRLNTALLEEELEAREVALLDTIAYASAQRLELQKALIEAIRASKAGGADWDTTLIGFEATFGALELLKASVDSALVYPDARSPIVKMALDLGFEAETLLLNIAKIKEVLDGAILMQEPGPEPLPKDTVAVPVPGPKGEQ